MELKDECVLGDPNFFLHIPFRDSGEEKPIEMCSLELDPLHIAIGNDEVINIVDTDDAS